jgi:thioesterase domain-containing protein
MADSALDQINAAHPRGEIRLLGYSLGGGVAFEVAKRLIAAGRSVEFFGILDTSIESSEQLRSISRTLQQSDRTVPPCTGCFAGLLRNALRVCTER